MLSVEWLLVMDVLAMLAILGEVALRRQASIQLALVGSDVPPRGYIKL